MKGGPRLTRRQAIHAVGAIAGTLYAKTTYANQQGRVMSLVLDDIQAIEIRHRGRSVTVYPAAIIDALSGKEA